jgi:hypothetical protein
MKIEPRKHGVTEFFLSVSVSQWFALGVYFHIRFSRAILWETFTTHQTDYHLPNSPPRIRISQRTPAFPAQSPLHRSPCATTPENKKKQILD